VLRDHGSSLGQAFADHTAARLDGSFSHPLLAGRTLNPNGRLILKRRGRQATQLVIGHLAARAIVLRARGGGGRCRSRRAKVSVVGPAANDAYVFVARLGERARGLRLSGDRVSFPTRLSPCSKTGSRLAVANASPAGGDQAFTVTVRVLRHKRP
jgi:hypothetical protein